MDASSAPSQKPHRQSRSKAKPKSQGKSATKQAVAKPGAFARRIRLSADRAQKRAPNPSLPLDRAGGDAAPRIVAVVGPAAVGKSTIIRNLVKHYSKRTIPVISGPITTASGRRKRITFLEVSSDLSSMIDAAKVADLILLVIDASFGFEMETFEFLNIAAAHGMPKVIAVLTHLDKMRDGKQVRRTKKTLKDRIWAELYDGAKVFYLSGITTTGDYLNREVLNLARFISVAKHARVKWRNDHPYVLADRVEDITPESMQSHTNRSIAAYGYLRGTPLRMAADEWRVHLAGVGDLVAKNVEQLPDPCPAPESPHVQRHASNASSEQPKRKRTVSDRDRVIYAPMAPEVDGIAYDRDAVYINLASEGIRFSDRRGLVLDVDTQNTSEERPQQEDSSDGEGEKMVKDLQKTRVSTIDESLGRSTIRLVAGGRELVSKEFSYPHKGEQEEPFHGRRGLEKDSTEHSLEKYGNELDGQTPDGTTKGPFNYERLMDGEQGVPPSQYSSTEEESNHYQSDCTSDSDVERDGDAALLDSQQDGEERTAERWKRNMLESAKQKLQRSVSPSRALTKYVYESDRDPNTLNTTDNENRENQRASVEVHEYQEDDSFFRPKRSHSLERSVGSSLFSSSICDDLTRLLPDSSKSWNSSEMICSSLRKHRFGTGQSEHRILSSSRRPIAEVDEIMGDFADLEPGEPSPRLERAKVATKDKVEDSDSDIEKIRERKIRQKSEFDAAWERRDRGSHLQALGVAETEENATGGTASGDRKTYPGLGSTQDPRILERDRLDEAKRIAFEDLHDTEKRLLEGIMPGQYVRIELQDVPMEFVKHFSPNYPVILGGLRPSDDEGDVFLRARIRRHRFKRGVLKSHDPIIFSVGWRRFQSMPVYDTEDQGGRKRFLKYTPEYLHCNSTFWGPSVAPGAGVVMCQSLGRDRHGFRIAGTGHITEVDSSFEAVKKLKLVGEPFKVHKNTAFIKGMFSSELEVSKYIGASIQTVSGIRGTVKKAISEAAQRGALDRDIAKSPAGSFRAGFEDKVLLSDIVFLRAWVPVQPTKFYSIATTLLDNERTGKGTWQMRTIREIREDRQLPIPLEKDSIYAPIERLAPQLAPLKLSRKLEGSLPYASKPKNFAPKKIDKIKLERKAAVVTERAVVLDKSEIQEHRLLQAVYTIRNDRSKRRREANARRLERRKRELEQQEEKRLKFEVEKRKRKHALDGARSARLTKRSRTNETY